MHYSSCFSNVFCLTYAFYYELLFMQLYKSFLMCVDGLTCHFNLWIILHFILWFHSACVFLSSGVLLQDSKGHTPFSPSCVRTFMHHIWLFAGSHTFYHLKLSYLPMCTTAIKALHYHTLLGLLLQMIWGLVRTSYRGDSLNASRSNIIITNLDNMRPTYLGEMMQKIGN